MHDYTQQVAVNSMADMSFKKEPDIDQLYRAGKTIYIHTLISTNDHCLGSVWHCSQL